MKTEKVVIRKKWLFSSIAAAIISLVISFYLKPYADNYHMSIFDIPVQTDKGWLLLGFLGAALFLFSLIAFWKSWNKYKFRLLLVFFIVAGMIRNHM